MSRTAKPATKKPARPSAPQSNRDPEIAVVGRRSSAKDTSPRTTSARPKAIGRDPDAQIKPRMKRNIEPDDVRVLDIVEKAGDEGIPFDEIQEQFVPKPVVHRVGELFMVNLIEEVVDKFGEIVAKVYVITDSGRDLLDKHRRKLASEK